MTSKLKWEKCSLELNPIDDVDEEAEEQIVYLSNSDESNDASLQKAVQESVDKAISLFAINVLESSRYFICEWDVIYSTLSIVVSDDTKQIDSKFIVKSLMTGLNEQVKSIKSDLDRSEINQNHVENIRYWISNYLTTNSDFMQYSLIALFHCESRNKTQLL